MINDLQKSGYMNKPDVAVIGYGSIGQRHARILQDLGCQVAIISRRPLDNIVSYLALEQLFNQNIPDYIVVATETNDHHIALQNLKRLQYDGKLLIEKPLFNNIPQDIEAEIYFVKKMQQVVVGYNLRFHPVIMYLKSFLKQQKIYHVQMHVGQWLPDWRPQTDYRHSYSAYRGAGGGVLRDLSHELDLLLWLFGKCQKVCALMGQVSDLEIASEDAVSVLAVTENVSQVAITMTYLDQPASRFMRIIGEFGTIEVDLIAGHLFLNGECQFQEKPVRDQTYIHMHQAILSGQYSDRLCDFKAGLAVNQLIAAIEMSQDLEKWIKV